jgi:acetyltransferase-like isoleucine patch superfamily enzyme
MKERGWAGLAGWCRVLYLYIFKAWFWAVCAELCPSNLTPFFHRLRGVKIGRDVFIDRSVILDGIYPELIRIGDDARLAPGSIVYCHSKAGKHLRETSLPNVVAGVEIGESAFVGLRAIILPGVSIGKGSVVVSGSVVYRPVPDGCVVSGNPAKVIRRLS